MRLSAKFFAEALACPLPRAEKYAPALRLAMERYAILVPGNQRQTYFRVSHFLAQIGHESQALSAMEENLNYSAEALLRVFPKYFTKEQAAAYARQPKKIASRVYGGRMGNGPESTEDGWRYRGRGAIQLTGKDNYRAYTRHLHALGMTGVDFVERPEPLSDPAWSIDVAGWYWNSRSISTWADQNDLRMVTIRINGGTHGLPGRARRLDRARQMLRVEMNLQGMPPLPPEGL